MAVDFIRRNKQAAAEGKKIPHPNIIRVWNPTENKGVACTQVEFEGGAKVASDPLKGAEHLGRPEVHAWIEVAGPVMCLMENGEVVIV